MPGQFGWRKPTVARTSDEKAMGKKKHEEIVTRLTDEEKQLDSSEILLGLRKLENWFRRACIAKAGFWT